MNTCSKIFKFQGHVIWNLWNWNYHELNKEKIVLLFFGSRKFLCSLTDWDNYYFCLRLKVFHDEGMFLTIYEWWWHPRCGEGLLCFFIATNVFKKCNCKMHPLSFFCDGLGIFGVGIASNISERVLILFEWYGYIQKIPKFFHYFFHVYHS